MVARRRAGGRDMVGAQHLGKVNAGGDGLGPRLDVLLVGAAPTGRVDARAVHARRFQPGLDAGQIENLHRRRGPHGVAVDFHVAVAECRGPLQRGRHFIGGETAITNGSTDNVHRFVTSSLAGGLVRRGGTPHKMAGKPARDTGLSRCLKDADPPDKLYCTTRGCGNLGRKRHFLVSGRHPWPENHCRDMR